MARARNIKPGFFTNEALVELPFEARLLFIGLWTLADRAGRLEDRPKRIKMAIFPGDNVDVDACLALLAEAGFIQRYRSGDVQAIQVVNFSKHQNPHQNERESSIRAPEQHQSTLVQAPEQHQSTRADSLIPDSLIPDPFVESTTPESPPSREQPPPVVVDPGLGPIQFRACELVKLLRQRGAALQASDPTVIRWAETGVSDAEALTALDKALQQRDARRDPSPVNAGYLDAILVTAARARDAPVSPRAKRTTAVLAGLIRGGANGG